MDFFKTYHNHDVFSEVDTKSGKITYTVVIDNKTEEFDSWVNVMRAINISILNEKRR